MTTNICRITGCMLIAPNKDRAVWGDLHKIHDVWVFNACLGEDREADWDYDYNKLTTHKLRTITLRSLSYFERRGVIVFWEGNADLNKVAQEYLK